MTLGLLPTFAWAQDAPVYTASPSAKTLPSPTASSSPTLVGTNATCTLTATRGSGSFAPANVDFSAVSTVNGMKVDQFTYDFGDGEGSTGSGTLTHRYGQAGTYTVTAQPRVDQSLKVNPCKMTITLKAFPLVSHKSECTGLTLLAGSSWEASHSAQVNVTGFDNKGELGGYRLQTDDIILQEQSTGDFTVAVATPGAYTLKAYVKDTTGTWIGGEGGCSKNITVRTAGISYQPQTGPASVYWFSLAGLFAIWLGAELWYRQNHQTNG